MINRENFYLIIGKNIQELRGGRDLTIEQFSVASGLNLDKSTISGIENGKQNVSLYQLFLISKNFNVNLMDLLKGVDEGGSNQNLLGQSEIDNLQNF